MPSRRAYYVYGARNHTVQVHVRHDGVAPGSSGAIVIASNTTTGAATTDTRDITVQADFTGSVAHYSACAYFVNISDTGTAVTNGINVNLNLGGATWTPATDPVQFQAYDSAGLQPNTASQWANIRLSGDFVRGNGIGQSIVVDSTQSAAGLLTIDIPTAGISLPTLAGFTTSYLGGP